MTEDGKESSELDRIVQNIMSVLESEDSKVYSEDVIAEFKDPTNVGSVADADGVGIADGLCNDTMEITLKLDGDRIARCMFFTDGCGATIACGSRLTKIATGKTLEEALAIEPEYLAGLLGGLPDDHTHCTSLAVIALRNALRDCMRRRKAKEGGEQ
ncbi:MAG: iron-sulfur cluster assembly scaffold protein [Thermoplasmata archaeon]